MMNSKQLYVLCLYRLGHKKKKEKENKCVSNIKTASTVFLAIYINNYLTAILYNIQQLL